MLGFQISMVNNNNKRFIRGRQKHWELFGKMGSVQDCKIILSRKLQDISKVNNNKT